MIKLDSTTYNSKASQAAEFISSQIRDGFFKNGDRLPSIRELSKLTGFGVYSIQKAIEQLGNEGTLKTIPGSGTYVSEDYIYNAEGTQKTQIGVKKLAVFNAFFEGDEGPQLAHPGTIAGILNESEKYQTEVNLVPPTLDITSAAQVRQRVLSGGFDGVLWLYPAPSHFDSIQACKNEGISVVITSHSHVTFNAARVEGDEVNTGFNVGRFMLESSCESIVFFWLPSPGGNGNYRKMSYPHIGLIGGMQSSLLLGSEDDRRVTFELVDLQRSDIDAEFILNKVFENSDKKIGAIIPNYLGLQLFLDRDVQRAAELLSNHQIVIPTSIHDAKKLKRFSESCEFDVLVYKVETIGKLAVQKLQSLKQGLMEDSTSVVRLDFGKYKDVVEDNKTTY